MDLRDIVDRDVMLAVADLARRTGALGLEIGYMHDDVPIDQAGWYASVDFKGTRVFVDEQSTPNSAMLGLARRLLDGALCRCGQPVALYPDMPGCWWHPDGPRFVPSCDAPGIPIADGEQGDMEAMRAKFEARRR